ncbi:MAG: MBL fold metallo-hydrolase [Anaerolineae bacterium]|nr:MBL fold metallo-hydrolase [Anaerolineae bacterium]
MQQIAPNVYVKSFYPGVNAGFICTAGGTVAVDAPPLPDDARAWREQIERVAGAPIRWTILTDHHPDRLLGVGWLGAPVIAGRGTLRRLQQEPEDLWRTATGELLQRRPDAKSLEAARLVLPRLAVDGRMTLYDEGGIIVESIAGAAPGSIWVRLPDREVVFVGDTVVVGSHPFLAASPDTRAWLKTLVEMRRARFPAQLIVPGRGPACDKDGTRPLSDYIQVARRRIRSVHTAGGGRGDLIGLLVEFMAMFPVPEQEQEWVQQRVRTGLEHVYEQMRPEQEE